MGINVHEGDAADKANEIILTLHFSWQETIDRLLPLYMYKKNYEEKSIFFKAVPIMKPPLSPTLKCCQVLIKETLY